MTTGKIRVTGRVGRVTSTWTIADVTKTTVGIVQPTSKRDQVTVAQPSKTTKGAA